MLNFDPNATFKNSIYELVPSDSSVPANFNPQYLDILNNTGLINQRMGVLEAANLVSRMGQAESALSTLASRMAAIENRATAIEGRLDGYDGLNIADRITALEGGSTLYGPTETPPISAGPGTLWLKTQLFNTRQMLLIKVGNLSATTALWRNITPFLWGLSRKDYLVGVENTYSALPLPTSIVDLTVLRAYPTGVFIAPAASGAAGAVIEVFWNVPADATPNGFAQPSSGTLIYQNPNTDNYTATVLHGIAPLNPNHSIWVKTGLTGGNGYVWCSVKANFALDLRQG